MILISRKVDYAILVLCELAKATGSASARELSAKFGLSRPFIANILKDLCKHHFVESERGAKGGYRLAQKPDKISLAMVISSLEGPFRLMSCAEALPVSEPQCTVFEGCPIKNPLKLVHQRLLATLEDVTISELIHSPNLVALGAADDSCASCVPGQ